MRLANRFFLKEKFDLPWAIEAAGKEKLDRIKFQAHFFAQLTPQTGFGLFAPVQEATGNSPAAVRSKDVIEQKNPTVVIEYQRSGSGSETPVTKAHHATTNAAGQPPPNCAKKICQHQERRISWHQKMLRHWHPATRNGTSSKSWRVGACVFRFRRQSRSYPARGSCRVHRPMHPHVSDSQGALQAALTKSLMR